MQLWGWLLQRCTGIILVLLLAVHMFLTHFVSPQDPITLQSIHNRMNIPAVVMVNYLLLFLGLFHGLYGLQVVIMDMVPRKLNPKVVGAILTIMGIYLGVVGTNTLLKLTI